MSPTTSTSTRSSAMPSSAAQSLYVMAWQVAKLLRNSSTGLWAVSDPPTERGSSLATVWPRTIASQAMPSSSSVVTRMATRALPGSARKRSASAACGASAMPRILAARPAPAGRRYPGARPSEGEA